MHAAESEREPAVARAGRHPTDGDGDGDGDGKADESAGWKALAALAP